MSTSKNKAASKPKVASKTEAIAKEKLAEFEEIILEMQDLDKDLESLIRRQKKLSDFIGADVEVKTILRPIFRKNQVYHRYIEAMGARPDVDLWFMWSEYGDDLDRWKPAVRGLENNPMLPIWHDMGDEHTQEVIRVSTSKSLRNNLRVFVQDVPIQLVLDTNDVVNRRLVEIGVPLETLPDGIGVLKNLDPGTENLFWRKYKKNRPIDVDDSFSEYGGEWFDGDWVTNVLIPLCGTSEAISIAALSDLVVNKVDLFPEDRLGHLFRHLLPLGS